MREHKVRLAAWMQITLAAAALWCFCGCDNGNGNGYTGPVGPTGPAWDAVGWIPVLERAEITTFEYAEIQRNQYRWRNRACGSAFLMVQAQLVRKLDLASESFRQVTVLRNYLTYDPRGPSRIQNVFIVRSWLTADEVAEKLKAKGMVEGTLQGNKAWKESAGAPFFICLVDGHIIYQSARGEAVGQKILERILSVRAGKEPSLQTYEGMTELIDATPRTLPVDVAYGIEYGATPQPRATTRWKDSESTRKVEIALFDSEVEANAMLEKMKPMLAARTKVKAEVTGKILTVTDSGPIDDVDRAGQAMLQMRVLAQALEGFKADNGRYPTTEEGLAALAKGGYLAGHREEAPPDPWREPYVYQFPDPDEPVQFSLRSMGPDRKKDTADDIFHQRR